ncbi:MAG: hypothetical protein U5K77_02140 [Candidatus Saccharibacteria bacterium]|nr:hypothetical protein [Candidatus Saccharibacteria bacterium]
MQTLELTNTHRLASDVCPELIEIADYRRNHLVGSIALAGSAEICEVQEPNPTTLLANSQEAALGSADALRRVRRNVSTDVAERLFKSGHITVVPLERTQRGLEQNGVPMAHIHQNTLEHMPLNNIMQNRTHRELGNIFLFEEMDTAGLLEEHDVVVMSATPTDTKTRQEYNFFTDTDSLSVQYLKKTGESTFDMETAMVAGKVSPNASRHDLRAVKQLLEEAGMEQAYFDENEALSFVMLVPKTATSGVHTVVERIDGIIGGTFFGEAKPSQDYYTYREVCMTREQQFDGLVDKITRQLLAEAHTFKRPYDAIERLDQLSSKYCIERAALDNTIDIRVFGHAAIADLEQARRAFEQGDIQVADNYLSIAKTKSTDSSCPLFKEGEESDPGSDDKDCEFMSKKCPICKAENVKTVVKKIGSSKNKKLITGSCGCRKIESS